MRSRSGTRPSCDGAGGADAGRAARRGGTARRRVCARSASAGRPCRRVSARTSRRRSRRFLACASIGAVWSSCSPDFGARSVIDRFAQIEPKVLLAVDGYRYGGKDFDRLGSRERVARRAADRRAHRRARLPRPRRTGWSSGDRRAITWDELRARGEGARARVRAGSVRPPALGALQLGHDGPAEGDRARPRRDPARDAEDDAPPARSAGRRPPLLVHDDGLDDVELPRRRARHRGVHRSLRRQPRDTGSRRALGSRRGGGDDLLRHQRRLHRQLPEGRPAAGRGTRPVGPAVGRARPGRRSRPRGSRLGLRGARRRRSGSSPPPAAPISAPRSSAASRRCRSTRASCRRGRSARGSRRGARRGARSSGRSASSCSPSRCPRCRSSSGATTDGSRYRESYFEMFPGVWRHGDWIEITERGTAIISGRSDATINRGGIRMGTSEIYRAVLALDEVVDALVLDLPLPGTDGFMPLFVVLREPEPTSTTISSRGSVAASARTARLGTCPTSSSRSPRCRGRSPARRSSSRSSASCSGLRPRPPSAATRSPTLPRSTPFEEMARRPPCRHRLRPKLVYC